MNTLEHRRDDDKLRDHFAGLAMQAIVGGRHWTNLREGVDSKRYRALADTAYSMASAMMRTRVPL